MSAQIGILSLLRSARPVLNSYLVYRGTWDVAATVKGHLSSGQQEARDCN